MKGRYNNKFKMVWRQYSGLVSCVNFINVICCVDLRILRDLRPLLIPLKLASSPCSGLKVFLNLNRFIYVEDMRLKRDLKPLWIKNQFLSNFDSIFLSLRMDLKLFKEYLIKHRFQNHEKVNFEKFGLDAFVCWVAIWFS